MDPHTEVSEIMPTVTMVLSKFMPGVLPVAMPTVTMVVSKFMPGALPVAMPTAVIEVSGVLLVPYMLQQWNGANYR